MIKATANKQESVFQEVAKIVSLFHFERFDKKLIFLKVIISFHLNVSPHCKKVKQQANLLLHIKLCSRGENIS